MRDLLNNSTEVNFIGVNKRDSADEGPLGAITGTTVDLKGEGRKILALLAVSDLETATMIATLEESIDDSTFTTLYAFGEQTTKGLTAVDLLPTKRYIRLRVSVASTDTVLLDYSILGVVYNERYTPSNIA